jgi:hypothetical protein
MYVSYLSTRSCFDGSPAACPIAKLVDGGPALDAPNGPERYKRRSILPFADSVLCFLVGLCGRSKLVVIAPLVELGVRGLELLSIITSGLAGRRFLLPELSALDALLFPWTILEASTMTLSSRWTSIASPSINNNF